MTNEEREALVLDHQGLMYRLVQDAMQRFGLPELAREDLCAAGNLALVQAAATFDPLRGTKFSSYAYPRVWGELIDTVRRSKEPNEVLQDSFDREAAPSLNPEEQLLAAERTSKLLQQLSVRERGLIESHYGKDESLAEIGKTQGLSKGWVSKLHARAIETLRDYERDDYERER
jgi:RNA polymerase sigma factor (sigma-70 family)